MSPLLFTARRPRAGWAYAAAIVIALILAYALVAWVDQSLGEPL